MPQAYDVKAKRMVEIKNPRIIKKKTKRGIVRFVTGTSSVTGIKVFRILPKK